MNESYSAWLTKDCLPAERRTELFRELMSLAMRCPDWSAFTLASGGMQLSWAAPLHWSRQLEWPWVLYEIQQHKKVGAAFESVLDVGGGGSVLSLALANQFFYYSIVDTDVAGLKRTIDEAEKLGHRRMRSVRGEAQNLPFERGFFDCIVCASVLEHIPAIDHEQCLKEMLRVLRPGGVAILTMDVKLEGVRQQNSYLTPDSLETLFAKGLLPRPENHIALKGSMSGDDGYPLVVTVLLSKLVKEK